MEAKIASIKVSCFFISIKTLSFGIAIILASLFAITETGDLLLPANKKPDAIGSGALIFSICIKSPFSSTITVFTSPSIRI